MDDTQPFTVEFKADTRQLRAELDKTTQLGTQFASTLTQAFAGLSVEGRSFGDVLRSLGQRLSELALTAALKPLENMLGNFTNQLLGGTLPFAKGGVLAQGTPVPFAAGGVIASPTTFPLAGGKTGLAGEAGPEAILPLARGPDGRLGVRGAGSHAVNVTFNVTSPDADSFRRSETQLSALLARAVGQGTRNL